MSETAQVKLCSCGAWIMGPGFKLCIDCRRKAKAKKFAPCSFPQCPETYVASGKTRYCVHHKSMTTGERKAAIAKLGLDANV